MLPEDAYTGRFRSEKESMALIAGGLTATDRRFARASVTEPARLLGVGVTRHPRGFWHSDRVVYFGIGLSCPLCMSAHAERTQARRSDAAP